MYFVYVSMYYLKYFFFIYGDVCKCLCHQHAAGYNILILFFNPLCILYTWLQNSRDMRELVSYHVLIQEAENYLKERAWTGKIYNGGLAQYKHVGTFNHNDDFDECRAAAPKNITAIEVFEDITENSNGEQFYMEHPDGTVLEHNSFNFRCVIEKVSFNSEGNKIVTRVRFKGNHNDLKLSREDKLYNVKVMD